MDQKLIDDLQFFFIALGTVNGTLNNEKLLPYIADMLASDPRMRGHLRKSRDQIDRLLNALDTPSTPVSGKKALPHH